MSQDVKFETASAAQGEMKSVLPLREGHEAPPVGVGMPVHNQKDSYQELERKYRHRTYQAQELMVEKILRGHCLYNEALERKLSMFDLRFTGKHYMVVLVRPSGNENMFTDYASDLRDGGQVGLIVSSIFSELLGEKYVPVLVTDPTMLLDVSEYDEVEKPCCEKDFILLYYFGNMSARYFITLICKRINFVRYPLMKISYIICILS